MRRILFLLALLLSTALLGCNRYERALQSKPATSEAQIHAQLDDLEARAIKLQIKMALARQLTPPLRNEKLGTPPAANYKE
ncbi:hypothetical protein HUU05_15450 [candidate division KSB1 bacterium]|nr:hypothetical protein [candidate division KSB1 bacterium]